MGIHVGLRAEPGLQCAALGVLPRLGDYDHSARLQPAGRWFA